MTNQTTFAPVRWIQSQWQTFATQRTVARALQSVKRNQQYVAERIQELERLWERWERVRECSEKEQIRQSLRVQEIKLNRFHAELEALIDLYTPYQELVDPRTDDERLKTLLQTIQCMCGANVRFIDCHGKRLSAALKLR